MPLGSSNCDFPNEGGESKKFLGECPLATGLGTSTCLQSDSHKRVSVYFPSFQRK